MNGGLPMLVDGHMHLENGPLTKEYVMEFIMKLINKDLIVSKF